MTKFLLDSGDPDEYREIAALAKQNGSELWGATTNPTLIAKKLSGPLRQSLSEASKKFTLEQAFDLQREIVLEIVTIVPGAVSAEVYADHQTTVREMIEQGREIATWHERVVVKLPTTIEGFKARTVLRKEGILTNNTLVFSLEQIFAICLHEEIIQQTYGPIPPKNNWQPFVSPFVGRLDDIGIDGMQLVEETMIMKEKLNFALPSGKKVWMLEASVRNTSHIKRGIDCNVELTTVPAKVLREWFVLSAEQKENLDTKSYAANLAELPRWDFPNHLLPTATEDAFFEALRTEKLDIYHDLTDKGIVRFAQDWQAILMKDTQTS